MIQGASVGGGSCPSHWRTVQKPDRCWSYWIQQNTSYQKTVIYFFGQIWKIFGHWILALHWMKHTKIQHLLKGDHSQDVLVEKVYPSSCPQISAVTKYATPSMRDWNSFSSCIDSTSNQREITELQAISSQGIESHDTPENRPNLIIPIQGFLGSDQVSVCHSDCSSKAKAATDQGEGIPGSSRQKCKKESHCVTPKNTQRRNAVQRKRRFLFVWLRETFVKESLERERAAFCSSCLRAIYDAFSDQSVERSV